jgi:ABC-2 type transport system ATP-binding protein
MNGEIMDQKKLLRDFSAGNKQKIGIIGAMLNTPQLLILDEPFNFLDPSSQYHLKQLLENYSRETKATILLSSHNLQHITEISDRILLMENGHILKDIPNENGSANEELDDYFKI